MELGKQRKQKGDENASLHAMLQSFTRTPISSDRSFGLTFRFDSLADVDSAEAYADSPVLTMMTLALRHVSVRMGF